MFPDSCGSEHTEDKNILLLLPKKSINPDPNFVNLFFSKHVGKFLKGFPLGKGPWLD